MDLKTFIKSVKALPSTAQIMFKLQQLLKDPNTDLEQITSLIKIDPALSTRIIAFSNSGYYASSESCQSIDEAVKTVGFQNIYELVGAASSSALLANDLPIYKIESGTLWQRSILCGLLLERLADSIDFDTHTAYTIGLLHGIGKVIINNYHLEYAIQGYEEISQGLKPSVEKDIFGFTHAEVAAQLLVNWNFPAEVYVPIHDQLDPLNATEFKKMAALLALVTQIAEEIETISNDNPDIDLNLDAELMEVIATSPETILEAIQKATEASSEIMNHIA